jgi:hypothetical protein
MLRGLREEWMDEEDESKEISINLSWELSLWLVPETSQMRDKFIVPDPLITLLLLNKQPMFTL